MRVVLAAVLVALLVAPAAAQFLPAVPGPLQLEAELSTTTPRPLSIIAVTVRVLDARGEPVPLAAADAVVYWRDRPVRYGSLPTSRFGATAIAIEIPATVAVNATYTVLVRASYRDLRATRVLNFTPRTEDPRP